MNKKVNGREQQGGRRPRLEGEPRSFRVEFKLAAREFAAFRDAARHKGLARGAYAAQIVLADVTGTGANADMVLVQALAELIRAAGLVRRIGVNLNQAVARLNATGQRSEDLLPYAAESLRLARRLDDAAEAVRQALGKHDRRNLP